MEQWWWHEIWDEPVQCRFCCKIDYRHEDIDWLTDDWSMIIVMKNWIHTSLTWVTKCTSIARTTSSDHHQDNDDYKVLINTYQARQLLSICQLSQNTIQCLRDIRPCCCPSLFFFLYDLRQPTGPLLQKKEILWKWILDGYQSSIWAERCTCMPKSCFQKVRHGIKVHTLWVVTGRK